MCKTLSELLQAEEPMFTLAIRQLEEASGKPSMDVRLTAEIIEKSHDRMRQMGLDPNDTTGEELYRALVNKVKEHDIHLAKKIGGTHPYKVQEMLPLIKQSVESVDIPRSCWVLKKSVAKDFLRETPPPNIMERLGYKSIDSMLKQENLAEIYGALRFAEGPEWLNAFNEHYKKLKPSDFETRKIEIVVMPERWGDISEGFVHKKRHNITHVKEMGVIIMLPMKMEELPGITMTDMPLLFHYINEIRLYSAFFKLQQVKKDFGKIFVETLLADPGNHAVMAGQHIHWRVIQRYFGKLENEYHPEIFEPHVQPEDLHWRRAEDVLYMVDPDLKFWQGMDYVGIQFDGRPVTFNLMDVSFSNSNNTPYGQQPIFHFRESLWNEIFARYMGQKTLENQLLKQLDNEMIAPEKLQKGK